MKPFARWFGISALAAAIAVSVNLGLAQIPQQDHDGRTAVALIGILVLGCLGFLGLFFEMLDD